MSNRWVTEEMVKTKVQGEMFQNLVTFVTLEMCQTGGLLARGGLKKTGGLITLNNWLRNNPSGKGGVTS